MKSYDLVYELYEKANLSDEDLLKLLSSDFYDEKLAALADKRRREYYGDEVYLRGLIEFTNYCKNDCFYCGIRKSNSCTKRYRMNLEDILLACKKGYEMGFRTFVLQGGEDPYFTDDKICEIVSAIRDRFHECAITLSIGEKNRNSYKAYFEAGANRYLLRHETAEDEHYRKLHPTDMSLINRKKCLFDLKEIGYQVGAGFMVGSPFQTLENIVSDLRFLQEISPDMIGMGPFISQSNTPFSEYKDGSVQLTLRLISLLRLLFPYALIPATTALGSIQKDGRELGLKAGANVLMPNLTPPEERKKYELYDNKVCLSETLDTAYSDAEKMVSSIGYKVSVSVGNVRR